MQGKELHVVFGAGQTGSFLVESLLRRGFRVRLVKRRPGPLQERLEVALGDATDPAFCREAATGAVAVYHCMNPAYTASAWAELLPRYLENLVAAAGAAGARLVVMENLYMYGRRDGGPINEETPVNPCSRKGEIRARMAESLFNAHAQGHVRAVSGRASDFYGPGGINTLFGSHFWKPALAGKPALLLANPDVPHTYHFIPDVADGLATLGTASEDVTGRTWMLPCANAGSTRALVGRFARVLGRDIPLRVMPRPAVKILSLFMPALRELGEMMYQWEAPFVVDDAQFRTRFGTRPTDPDAGAEATVAWARAEYGNRN